MGTVEKLGFYEYMNKYPHNTDCSDKFMLLVELAYNKDTRGLSIEEFIDGCLAAYGGTVAAAMIDYLNNN